MASFEEENPGAVVGGSASDWTKTMLGQTRVVQDNTKQSEELTDILKKLLAAFTTTIEELKHINKSVDATRAHGAMKQRSGGPTGRKSDGGGIPEEAIVGGKKFSASMESIAESSDATESDWQKATKSLTKASLQAGNLSEALASAKASGVTSKKELRSIVTYMGRWQNLSRSEKMILQNMFKNLQDIQASGGNISMQWRSIVDYMDDADSGISRWQQAMNRADTAFKKSAIGKMFLNARDFTASINNVIQKVSTGLQSTGLIVKMPSPTEMIKNIADYQKEIAKSVFQGTGHRGDILGGGTNNEYYKLAASAETTFDETGQDRLVVQKQLVKNLRRGITDQGKLNSVTKKCLRTATLIGADAEATGDEFANWQTQLGLGKNQLGSLEKSILNVARTTGITGNNLLDSVKSAKQFADMMRDAGHGSEEAWQNLVGISAVAKQMGTEKSVNPLMAAMSDNVNLMMEADDKTRAMLFRSAQFSGDPEVMEALRTGTLTKSPELMAKMAGGMERDLMQFTKGKKVSDMSPAEKANANLSVFSATGRRLGEYERTIETLRKGIQPGGAAHTPEEELKAQQKGLGAAVGVEAESQRAKEIATDIVQGLANSALKDMPEWLTKSIAWLGMWGPWGSGGMLGLITAAMNATTFALGLKNLFGGGAGGAPGVPGVGGGAAGGGAAGIASVVLGAVAGIVTTEVTKAILDYVLPQDLWGRDMIKEIASSTAGLLIAFKVGGPLAVAITGLWQIGKATYGNKVMLEKHGEMLDNNLKYQAQEKARAAREVTPDQKSTEALRKEADKLEKDAAGAEHAINEHRKDWFYIGEKELQKAERSVAAQRTRAKELRELADQAEKAKGGGEQERRALERKKYEVGGFESLSPTKQEAITQILTEESRKDGRTNGYSRWTNRGDTYETRKDDITKIIEGTEEETKKLVDALTTKGSVYTHDIHLEEALNRIFPQAMPDMYAEENLAAHTALGIHVPDLPDFLNLFKTDAIADTAGPSAQETVMRKYRDRTLGSGTASEVASQSKNLGRIEANTKDSVKQLTQVVEKLTILITLFSRSGAPDGETTSDIMPPSPSNYYTFALGGQNSNLSNTMTMF